jgi:adenine-specific DNA methylase
MLAQGAEPEFAKAVATYLALILDKLLDWNSCLATWIYLTEAIGHTFTRQALPMVWDYFETNVISSGLSDWLYMLGRIEEVLAHLTRIPPVEGDSDG